MEELAIRMQISKPLDSYTKTTPQHVKAARQLEEAGRDISAGDIISFVKTTKGVKPVEHASIQDIDIAIQWTFDITSSPCTWGTS